MSFSYAYIRIVFVILNENLSSLLTFIISLIMWETLLHPTTHTFLSNFILWLEERIGKIKMLLFCFFFIYFLVIMKQQNNTRRLNDWLWFFIFILQENKRGEEGIFFCFFLITFLFSYLCYFLGHSHLSLTLENNGHFLFFFFLMSLGGEIDDNFQ